MSPRNAGPILLFLAAMFFACIALLLRLGEQDVAEMCTRACGVRRGVVVEGACYCENEGEALVPIEQLLFDTGKCTDL